MVTGTNTALVFKPVGPDVVVNPLSATTTYSSNMYILPSNGYHQSPKDK